MQLLRVCMLNGIAAWAAVSSAQAVVVISSNATHHMSCSAGVCTATAANATMNINDLENMLASGDLEISSGGSVASDITVSAAISWTSVSKLTLRADRNIVVNRPISVAGTGDLDLESNGGSVGGSLTFGPQGNATFFSLTSKLTVAGANFKLFDRISTLAAAIASNVKGHYALAKSYDASADGTYAAAPIQTTFLGTFEGLGNTISNLTINDPTANSTIGVGLFADTYNGSIVRHLRLSNVNITAADESFVGGIAGYAYGTFRFDTVTGKITTGALTEAGGLAGFNDGTIHSSSATVSLRSSAADIELGGLVGLNATKGKIDHSYATGTVAAAHANNQETGGLVGSNSGAITDSHATGKIIADGTHGAAGGLVGFQSGGSIGTSYATGTATASDPTGDAGGLVGDTSSHLGTVSQSFATGVVTAGGDAGGLIGRNDSSAIDNSYSTGAVTGSAVAGGLIGDNGDTIATSYSMGAVSGALDMGGLIGEDDAAAGSLTSDYWDTTTSGITDPSKGAGAPPNDPGITPRSNAQLRASLPAGFSSSIWGQQTGINGGLPYLLANPPP